ncbi:hypothetical protein [Pedobacter endophyticus]|uniref:F5/8 type C domain-containing protein n=1 Tax=Pedobacter endophyticus TaxID=2789740 RepID=A0A7S9KYZ9_9SPHI|nr:hypothetical protein [Pedobacter endophyticus]QPH39430.1 hypothetical protein IZT61_20700 [Pedobacter endophyticus]
MILKPTYFVSVLSCILFCLHATLCCAQSVQNPDNVKVRAYAINAVAALDQNNHYSDFLTPADLNELPVGLKRTLNNITYKIAISSAVFHPTYAELTVYAKVEIPQNPRELFFGISGLKLSYEGGIVGDAKLVLLGDIPIDFNGGNGKVVLKGGLDLNNGQALDNLTYITMDCKGFKEMGLAADVIFPRKLLIPCDPNGDQIADSTKKVTGSFSTVVSDWNDILVNVNLPKFQIAKLKDVVFTVANATIDLSDRRNSPNVLFPRGYEARYMPFPSPGMWRGLYIQNLDVMLPRAFAKRNSKERISFGSNNLIIDNNGVSGSFYGKNILPYSEGSASGWKFSVDEFNIDLEANTLVGAGFRGNIGLPVSEKDSDSLRYEAVITGDNKYWLTVAPKDKLDFSLWQARVTLDKNSYVKLLVQDDKFLPEANLYGRMDIMARRKEGDSTAKPLANFKGIEFKGLRLKTVAPYLTVEYFGYNGELSVANFPVSIDSIALTSTQAETSLSFGLKVTLMDAGFKADTRLVFTSGFEQRDGLQKWKFRKLGLSSIRLNNVNIGKVKLDGELNILDNDPIYGDGFGGGIRATFEALGKAEVQVRAIFGRKDFRYWFVDGKASFGTGFPIAPPTPINIKGFVGGIYYRMSKIYQNASSDSKSLMPEYKPDLAMGLGVKAGLLFNITKDEVCDGMVEFEMAFNRNGGLSYIGLFGSAKFMGKIPIVGDALDEAAGVLKGVQDDIAGQLEGLSDALKIEKLDNIKKLVIEDPQKAARTVPNKVDFAEGLAAYLGISYDFANSTFHANFDIYINAAKGLLRGVGANNRAGYAVLHFAPKEWYVYMGTPTDPIGIQFGLGSFSLKTESYFMIGTKIPGSPPPPREVADILGLDIRQLDYMRDLNALGDGKGFALGSRLAISTGDITFLILYANFKAGVGFDLMLKQYPDAHCEGSSDPIGIRGWYANAQAYAYLQGELGIKVNLWFLKTRIPIIKAGVAALLQAKLPNPSWFRGYLGVQYNVLGGLIKGRANFKVQLGDECKIVNGGQESPVGINVIADMSPKTPDNVDVFAAPQVALNFPVERDIPIMDENGSKTFRIKLEKFELTSNGKQIPGKLEWNAGKDAVSFLSTEILPPNTAIKAYAKVSFVQLVGGNWQTVYMDGKKAEEEKSIDFKTGTAPETIPLTNIAYSWPVVDQRNFYTAESSSGYVQLKRGQSYLFNAKGFKQELAFKKENGNALPVTYQYDSARVQLRFDLPKVEANSSYSFVLVSKSQGSTTGSTTTTQKSTTAEGDVTEITNKQAQDVIRSDGGKVLLGYNFHSSAFATFREKMAAITPVQDLFGKVSSDVIDLRKTVAQYEAFDLAEITGTAYTASKPLLRPIALLDNNYYQQDIKPLNYEKYPIAGDITLDRDTAQLGLAPVRALPILLSYQANVEQGNFNTQSVNQRLPYIYDLPRIYKADFQELQSQVVNRFLGTPQQQQYEWLINGHFPFMREGNYRVQYRFMLPNGSAGTSAVVNYNNPIK